MTSTSPVPPDVVIVGAGIGGLTAALALHAHGLRACVLEGAAALRPLGVGINVQPAAVGHLTALGLAAALGRTGVATREMRYVDSTGAVLASEPRGLAAGHPHPQLSIHRGALQMLLAAAVRERLGTGAIRTGARVTRLEEDADGVTLHLTDPATGATTTTRAGLVVGADGLRSVVRRHVTAADDPLVPAGVQMWRGVTELDRFLDGRTMVVANDPHGTRLVAYPISAEHQDRGRALLNWVCLVATGARDPQDADWDRSGRLQEVLPHYADWHLGWLDVADVLRRSNGLLRYPMVDRDPLERWSTARTTLLGDAAHLMYPIGANGASQAVLDAAALADGLASGIGTAAALRRYEAGRRPATTAVVLANRRMDARERVSAGTPGPDQGARFARLSAEYRAVVDRANG